LKDIDLKNISQLTYSYSSRNTAKIEVHTDSPSGNVISTFNIKGNGNDNTIQETAALTDPQENMTFILFSQKHRLTEEAG
jgi:hypothetical protein